MLIANMNRALLNMTFTPYCMWSFCVLH